MAATRTRSIAPQWRTGSFGQYHRDGRMEASRAMWAIHRPLASLKLGKAPRVGEVVGKGTAAHHLPLECARVPYSGSRFEISPVRSPTTSRTTPLSDRFPRRSR